jgi:hypothetical protein
VFATALFIETRATATPPHCLPKFADLKTVRPIYLQSLYIEVSLYSAYNSGNRTPRSICALQALDAPLPIDSGPWQPVDQGDRQERAIKSVQAAAAATHCGVEAHLQLAKMPPGPHEVVAPVESQEFYETDPEISLFQIELLPRAEGRGWAEFSAWVVESTGVWQRCLCHGN